MILILCTDHFTTTMRKSLPWALFTHIILFNLHNSLYNTHYHPHLTDEETDLEMQKSQMAWDQKLGNSRQNLNSKIDLLQSLGSTLLLLSPRKGKILLLTSSWDSGEEGREGSFP